MTLHGTSTSDPVDSARQPSRRQRFRDLHVPGRPLLLPNPWDAGSAKVLESLGFAALATTSGGFAGSLGRLDGTVTREDALAHGEQVAAAVTVPVSADLENGFLPDPAGVADTVRLAAATGLAGCSIEDHDRETGLHPIGAAAERVAAAAEAAHAGPDPLVLTARADGFLHGLADLADTIARLQAYERAGADVLYAPGVTRPDDLRRLLDSVSRPVNVLALPDAPDVGQLAELGVARISVGSGFYLAAMGALADAGRELLHDGSFGYWDAGARGREVTRAAFT